MRNVKVNILLVVLLRSDEPIEKLCTTIYEIVLSHLPPPTTATIDRLSPVVYSLEIALLCIVRAHIHVWI